MFASRSTLAAALLAVTAVSAKMLTVTTRADAPQFPQCDSVRLTWAEGQAPYNVNITATKDGFSQTFQAEKAELVWIVKAPVDSDVSFLVTGANNASSGGGPFHVVKGSDSSCLQSGSSSDTLAPSSAAPTSTTAAPTSSSAAAPTPSSSEHPGLVGGIIEGAGQIIDGAGHLVDHLIKREDVEEVSRPLSRNTWDTLSDTKMIARRNEHQRMVKRVAAISKAFEPRSGPSPRMFNKEAKPTPSV